MNQGIFDCTAMPLFCCATLFLFSARMLIVQNITIFCLHHAAIFDASSYFCFITFVDRSVRHDILILPQCPSFWSTTIFLFATNSFRSPNLTPLFSCAALRARSFKFMPRWSRQEQHGVRKDSLNLPRFYSRIQVHFLFLPRTCFLLFHALDFTQLLCFTYMLSCIWFRKFITTCLLFLLLASCLGFENASVH